MARKRSTPPPRLSTREVNRLLDELAEGAWRGVWNPHTASRCLVDEGRIIGLMCPAGGCHGVCAAYGKEFVDEGEPGGEGLRPVSGDEESAG